MRGSPSRTSAEAGGWRAGANSLGTEEGYGRKHEVEDRVGLAMGKVVGAVVRLGGRGDQARGRYGGGRMDRTNWSKGG